MFAGVFNDEFVGSGQMIPIEAIVHTTFAVISYAALLALMVVFNIILRNTPFRRRLIWFTAAVVSISMPLLALFIFKEGSYFGLFQRVGYGITLFWVVIITLKLILFLKKLAKLT